MNDEILTSMKRGTAYQKTDDLLRSFREKVPNMAIRTSLIVGYPGETEERFQELREEIGDVERMLKAMIKSLENKHLDP